MWKTSLLTLYFSCANSMFVRLFIVIIDYKRIRCNIFQHRLLFRLQFQTSRLKLNTEHRMKLARHKMCWPSHFFSSQTKRKISSDSPKAVIISSKPVTRNLSLSLVTLVINNSLKFTAFVVTKLLSFARLKSKETAEDRAAFRLVCTSPINT